MCNYRIFIPNNATEEKKLSIIATLKKIACIFVFTFYCLSYANAIWVDRTDQGGIVTASSQIHERESKEMAFDNTTASKWLTKSTATGWIQFQFPNDQRYTITRYSIASANDESPRDPRNWTLYGSNDEENWFAVDVKTGESWTDRFQRREFVCSSPGKYNYYRLDITLNNGSTDLTGFSEMELLEDIFIAENPTPANHAENIDYNNVLLSWDSPSELTNPEFQIYMSDSLSLVEQGDPSVLIAQQYETSLAVGAVSTFTNYYWRVDVLDGGDPGLVWQFLTEQPNVDCLHLTEDIDLNCQVDMADIELLASQWLAKSCQGGICADIDNSSKVDLTDFAAVSQAWTKTGSQIVLHEIMADNETTLADNFGEYPDWIEIRNLSNTAVNLQGWYLTDDEDDLTQWEFPDKVIGPLEYLIVYASGRDITDDPDNLHLNFKLSKDGQYLALVRPDLSIAHEFNPGYPELGNDESYGLTVLAGNNTFVTSLLASPTPYEANDTAVVWDFPEFSMESGFHDEAFSLELSLEEPGFEIRYTLDGSVPDHNSFVYDGPLTISNTTCIRASAFRDKYLPGKPQTRTFIFLDDVVQQPELPDGFPSLWKTTAADYEMDPDIVNHQTYGPMLHDSLLSLPTISIVTDQDNLFDSNTGIYSNPTQEGVEWERPAFVELITPDDSEEFQIDCGLRIQGGAFRRFDLSLKKSFRLLFKRQYSKGKLDFPLFEHYPGATDSFDTLTLRAGANDGYSWTSARYTEQFIRDEFGRSVQRDSGNAGSHGTFVHLYINGAYWGLYNTVERPDNAFSATYYGGDKDDWDAINSGDISEGSMDAWNTLITKCQAGVNTLAKYQELQGNKPDGSRNPEYPNLIDMENYIDYIIINMWGGNGDWPWRNYWLGRDRTEDSEGFKFYCWDYEGTMASPFAIYNKVTADFNSGAGIPHHQLKDNPEYRMLFADRVYRMFFNGGALTTDVNIERYTRLANWVESAIVAESARWGDMHFEPPLNFGDWIAKRDDILNNYLPDRSDIVLGQLKDAGYFPLVDAPVLRIDGVDNNGGHVANGAVFTIAGEEGGIRESLLLPESHPVKYYVATDDSLGLSWTTPGFTPDSQWIDGSTGVGYERGTGYDSLIGSDVEDIMYNKATSIYCRLEFTYSGSPAIEELLLDMKYDDGFIAYINGVEVCRSNNINVETPADSTASNHEAGASFEQFDITSYIDLLNTGTNVLAIHGINYANNSSDLIFLPRIVYRYYSSGLEVPVLCTLDGTDPRLPGGDVSPSALEYTGPYPLPESIKLKCRTYDNGQWSALNETVYAVGPVLENLRITEIMYNPATDPNSEFIELINIGTESINLNMVRFTKGIDFTFGSLDVAPGDRIVVIKDADVFAATYPDFSGVIAGVYLGNLDNGGERVKIVDALDTEILDFEYKDSWYDITDGDGFSLVIRNPEAEDVTLWDEKSGWQIGNSLGGSPGAEESGEIPPVGAIVINEVLAHSDTQQYDWIELYNTTDQPINIGGWYLSDNNDDDAKRKKYQIPEGTVILDDGYVVFYENLNFGNISDPGCSIPFQLSENGEKVYLQSGKNGVLTGYYVEEDFGASDKDIAFGRYQKSDGGYNFVAMSRNTPGDDNAYPKVGPVVITEIMYHPENDSDAEYVELQNISESSITLADPLTGLGWRFVDDKDDIGIEYHFPTNQPVVLEANEKLLLVKNLSAFVGEFGQPAQSLKVFEWLDGSLSNSKEKPEIQLPGDVDELFNQYYIRVDRVSYDDDDPWPTNGPDGDGMSLTRTDNDSYGNDPVNWQSDTPTPGY